MKKLNALELIGCMAIVLLALAGTAIWWGVEEKGTYFAGGLVAVILYATLVETLTEEK